MNILGLDLGCKTGFAYNRGDDFEAGVWKWKLGSGQKTARMDRRCDPRVLEFFEILLKFRGKTDVVVFEDVEFAEYRLQVQLWSSYRAAVWLAFGREPNTIVECVPVTTLKRFATGHGGATKEMMETAAFKRLGISSQSGWTDDTFDAIWLHAWANDKFARLR